MFDKEYSFRGKHCDYVIKLTAEYDGKRHKLFPTNYDVYEIAPIIGFLYGRQAELDKSGDATKIFPDKLLKEQQNPLHRSHRIHPEICEVCQVSSRW